MKRRFLPPGKARGVTITLVLGALVGLIAIGGGGTIRSVHSPVEKAWAIDQDDRAAIEAAKGISRAFIAVSKEVVPSVVTITSNKVMRPAGFSGHGRDRDMSEFFRFFGMPDIGNRPERENEVMQRALGSGVIVSDDGYIVTNTHVVSDAREISVLLEDGSEYNAEVIGADSKTDIAVIKIDADGLPAIRMGDSDDLEVGEWVIAVGSPFSQYLEHSVTAGIVSAKSRNTVGLADYEDFIQTDAAINPGNSGGALVNLDGELIGINAAIASRSGGSQGVGFAIPINMVRRIQESLMETGHVTRGWIGIGIQSVSREIREALDLPDRNGVLISSIVDDSPADDANLRRQDVIVSLNKRKVESMRGFRNKIASMPPGTEVEIGILRKGREKDIRITLGTLPDDEQPVARAEEIGRERLGIEVARINRELRRNFELGNRDGVVITGVDRRSPAATGGLRAGDVIIEINQEEIADVRDCNTALDGVNEGEVALFLVERGGNTLFIAIRIPN